MTGLENNKERKEDSSLPNEQENIEMELDDNAQDHKESLIRVGSRSNLTVWRGEGVVSDGGSIALMERLSQIKPKRKRRQGSCSSCEPPQFARNLAYVNTIIKDLQWALAELLVEASSSSAMTTCRMDLSKLEHIAIFLDRSLTQQSRLYHSVAHVFQISAGASPLQVLAVLFRDVVKESIDRCDEHTEQHDYWKDLFLKNEKDSTKSCWVIRKDVTLPHELLVLRIFGYVPEQDLSHTQSWQNKGLDMFLSAWVATQMLWTVLPADSKVSLGIIAQVCACIEATIPFRPQGSRHLETLYERLVACNQEFDLGLSDSEMEVTVQQACDVWNRQVGNMAQKDVAVFLDHTWRLMPEHEKALQQATLYTLNDYHSAMIDMEGFLSLLMDKKKTDDRNDIGHEVFLEFRGIPSPSESTMFRERFQSNATLALSYIGARLLSVSVVSAMACQTGGQETPMAYFFGDTATINRTSVNLGHLLTMPPENETNSSCNSQVLDLLHHGEACLMDVGFDGRNTGVAAYLYACLGEDNVQELLQFCRQSPMTSASSMQLLRALPLTQVVEPILSAFRFMAVTRGAAVDQLRDELRSLETAFEPQSRQLSATKESSLNNVEFPKDAPCPDQQGSSGCWHGLWQKVPRFMEKKREKRRNRHSRARTVVEMQSN